MSITDRRSGFVHIGTSAISAKFSPRSSHNLFWTVTRSLRRPHQAQSKISRTSTHLDGFSILPLIASYPPHPTHNRNHGRLTSHHSNPQVHHQQTPLAQADGRVRESPIALRLLLNSQFSRTPHKCSRAMSSNMLSIVMSSTPTDQTSPRTTSARNWPKFTSPTRIKSTFSACGLNTVVASPLASL